jgi:hypothetical protein
MIFIKDKLYCVTLLLQAVSIAIKRKLKFFHVVYLLPDRNWPSTSPQTSSPSILLISQPLDRLSLFQSQSFALSVWLFFPLSVTQVVYFPSLRFQLKCHLRIMPSALSVRLPFYFPHTVCHCLEFYFI